MGGCCRREAEAEIKYWMESPLGEAGGWDGGLGFTFRQCEVSILDYLMVGLLRTEVSSPLI
jgi:hypothetical protein